MTPAHFATPFLLFTNQAIPRNFNKLRDEEVTIDGGDHLPGPTLFRRTKKKSTTKMGGGGFDPFFGRCNQYNLVFHPPQQRGAKMLYPIHALAEANDDPPRDASLCASKTAARLSWSWLQYIQPRKNPQVHHLKLLHKSHVFCVQKIGAIHQRICENLHDMIIN